jgi:predicted glycosyltransferase/glycosyltransferase involved in cell wall biosynthesis
MSVNAVVHIFVATFDAGGMGHSIVRIANQIVAANGARVVIYTRDMPKFAAPPDLDGRCELVNLTPAIQLLHKPFESASESQMAMRPVEISEYYRTVAVVFSNAVRARAGQDPGARHVIMSFYAVNQGFMAQHVASELRLPHIACVRGSDFSRYYFSPYHIAAFSLLCRNATWIVTTNQTQERALRDCMGRTQGIRTIYSSVAAADGLRWEYKKKDYVQVVSDCGYSIKKGTHILLDAIQDLRKEGRDIRLSLVGPTDGEMENYWNHRRQELTGADPEGFRLGGSLPKEEIDRFILNGDLYCSTSMGEGSSVAIGRAMILGLPVVATETGSHYDMAGSVSHVLLSPRGDPARLKSAIREMADRIQSGAILVDQDAVENWRSLLSPEREQAAWQEVVADAAGGRFMGPAASQRRKRIVFFVHDGTGLGHLHRVCRLAKALQGRFSCFVITGHRAAAWLVPEECEFLHLPSLDSLFEKKARQWGRRPFADMPKDAALRFRQMLINSAVEAFEPDAIVTDYLPLGKNYELKPIIESSRARKYLILRGVLDTPENVATEILGGFGEEALRTLYDSILVASDRRICDVAREYPFPAPIAAKMQYVGYVSTPVSAEQRVAVRRERGVGDSEAWVVCSANAGLQGASLNQECRRIPELLPEAWFDLVQGPRSATPWDAAGDCITIGRSRYFKECRYLSALHGGADVVVCGGGYNSLVESMEGGARIVCCPVQDRGDDEQHVHSERLSAYYPIRVEKDPSDVPGAVIEELRRCALEPAPNIREALDFGGVQRIVEILSADLGVAEQYDAAPVPAWAHP